MNIYQKANNSTTYSKHLQLVILPCSVSCYLSNKLTFDWVLWRSTWFNKACLCPHSTNRSIIMVCLTAMKRTSFSHICYLNERSINIPNIFINEIILRGPFHILHQSCRKLSQISTNNYLIMYMIITLCTALINKQSECPCFTFHVPYTRAVSVLKTKVTIHYKIIPDIRWQIIFSLWLE